MLLDSWNTYGVHPFYPFSTKWFYGDLIFIIEPFLWFSFALPLLFTFSNKWFWAPIGLMITGIPLFAATRGFVTWYSLGAVFSFALIVTFFAQRASSVSKKVLVGITAAVLYLVTQGYTSQTVRNRLITEFQPQSDQHKIIDLILSPLPANPFCWSVLQLEADAKNDKYIADGKLVSSWPSLIDASSCVLFRQPVDRVEMKLSELKDTAVRDCFVDAWLRFTRAPYIENSIAVDLRFERPDSNNFTTLKVSEVKRECPRFIPPWSKPRQDLLDL